MFCSLSGAKKDISSWTNMRNLLYLSYVVLNSMIVCFNKAFSKGKIALLSGPSYVSYFIYHLMTRWDYVQVNRERNWYECSVTCSRKSTSKAGLEFSWYFPLSFTYLWKHSFNIKHKGSLTKDQQGSVLKDQHQAGWNIEQN